jgi:hypothetical protein
MQKHPSLSPEEFWKSEEKHMFRFNYSPYAEWRKFREWLLQEVETKKSQTSYDEQVVQQFGEYDLMDDFDKDYSVKTTSPLFEYNRAKLHEGDKKWKPKSSFDFTFQPLEALSDEYLITEEV